MLLSFSNCNVLTHAIASSEKFRFGLMVCASLDVYDERILPCKVVANHGVEVVFWVDVVQHLGGSSEIRMKLSGLMYGGVI